MRILHGADFHLDSAFRALPPEKAAQRRRESRDLLDRLADLANDRGVDAVLLSGDLFDGNQVYRETLERLSQALGRIRCPVLIAPGNHDPYCPGSPYHRMDWPDNVHIFSGEREAVELPGGVIHGAAFTAAAQERSLLEGFSAPADGRVHIMCLHGDLTSGSVYNPITPREIQDSGLTYLALGHVHQASGLCRQGNTFYAYPGCAEGRGFDETGEKGVLLVQAEPGRVEAEAVALCARQYRIVEADVTGREILQAAEEAAAAVPPEDVLRLILVGETGEAGLDLPELEAALAPRFFGFQLQDRTRVAEDLWARAEEDSLRGLFLRELRGRYEAAGSPEEREAVDLAARFGLAAMDGRDLI